MLGIICGIFAEMDFLAGNRAYDALIALEGLR
jgi:hypothetical protein